MAKFTYSKVNDFDAKKFYEEHKLDDFVQNKENIKSILRSRDELLERLITKPMGQVVQIDGMYENKDLPLYVHRSKLVDESDVYGDLFTARRLSGLAAAWVYNAFSLYPQLYISEAEDLGLDWNVELPNNKSEQEIQAFKRKMYLSAVPGAEYFVEVFECCPLICGLKKFKRGDITEEDLLHMAKIRLPSGVRTATQCMSLAEPRNLGLTQYQRNNITFGRTFDLLKTIESLPEKLRCLFTTSRI